MGTTHLGKWLRKTRIHRTPSPSNSSDCITTVVSDLELEESNDALATRADGSPHQPRLSAASQSNTTPPPKPQKPKDTSDSNHPKNRPNNNGLILIHQPATDLSPTAPELQYPIDIVAVHGIMGDAYTTWTHSNGHFWLRDSLPEMFPGARIYSYGYPAKMFSRELGRIGDHATLLLEELRDQRRGVEEQKRPIIFICHSMGGIVVKKAINITVVDHIRFTNIRSSTAAIFFLATPHCGSDPAKLLSVVADIMNVPLVGGGMARFSGKFRADQIKTLARGSKTLLDISNDFREHPGNMKIYSFIEQNSTPPSTGKIVDDISGRMFVPGEVWVPMPGCNHREVARFESKESLGYNQILKKLSEVAEELTNKMSAELTAEDIPCLHSLSFPSMTARLEKTSQAHPQTCSWILTHPTFKTWTSSSGLLWVKGHPGTGKSTLMAFLYRYFQSQLVKRKKIFLCFFFHGNGTPMQKSQLGMFRSLMHQLYKQNSSARRTVLKVFNEKKEAMKGQEDLAWSLEELRALFQEIVLAEHLMQNNDIMILVDALDEAMDEGGTKAAQSLLEYFHQLNDAIISKGGKTKICLSCRTYPVVAVSGGLQISIQDENRRDIERFVDYQLRIGVEGWDLQPERVRWELEKAVVDKADGVFLWACRRVPRIVEDLNDGSASFEDIGKLLETESNELYAMYEDILTREIKTSLREKALLFMQWICLAERPLSLTEIRIAMACDESCMRLDQDKIEDSKDFVESDERMEKLIRSLSGGLAERRHDSTVQLFHQSVNDFLREGGLRTLFSAVGHSKTASLSDEKIIGRGEQMLSRSCFNYLRLGEIAGFSMTYGIKPVPTVDEVEENFHFLRYATKFCFLHAQRAEYLGVSQVDLAKLIDHPTKFVSSEDSPPQESLDYPPSIFETWTVMFEAVRRLREPNLTPRLRLIHTASDWNLQSTVRYLIEKGEQVDEQDWFGDTPLHHAVRAGHGELVSMLFDFGAEIESENCSLSTPLELAVKNRRVGITKLLLRRGADANRKTGGFSNILEAVCNTNGGAELASHVIKFGAEVNGEGGLRSTGPTALEGAAYAGDEETVRLLISKGANIHVQSEYYGSPLQAAVQGPCSKAKGVVKLLLEKGADINAQCGEYGNALQAAARRSSPEMIEFLLENGADLNIRGGHYGDALQACFASIYDEEVARLLLDHGAEINAQGGHYGSPLQSAADSGNLTTFRMLWEKGARADVKGGVHQSMIQAAGVGGNQDIVQLLLDNGSDINEQGGNYGTALQAAVYFNAERFVEFLLDKGADVNLQGGGFGNALCAAVVIRGEKMIELLLKRGADIHARPSGDYQSAFLLAAEKGNVKQMKALLDHGNDINPQDERYAEALKIAKGRRTKHVAELLLERKKANIARSK